MLLAFHSATTMTSSLETDIRVSAAAGFKALEIWTAKMDRYLAEHSPADLRALFEAHGVQPLALSSIEFIAFRGAEYPAVRARLLELCAIAQTIGCPTIVLVPSPLPNRGMTWEQVRQEYVTVLGDLSALAAPYPVRLTLEPLGFGWCSLRTPRAAQQILDLCGCSNLGQTVDAAHFTAGGGALTELEALDGERIFGFHLDDQEDLPREAMTDATRLLPGMGILPLEEICGKLRAIGYNGPCAVETFRPAYWEQDPYEVARMAYAAARRVLDPFFDIE